MGNGQTNASYADGRTIARSGYRFHYIITMFVARLFSALFVQQGQVFLDWYQREYIKDYNVQISSWERAPVTAAGAALESQQQQQDADGNDAVTTAFQRTMTFTHPINNNDHSGSSASLSLWSSSLTSMMGPTEAQTTRHQHLQCFGRFGMIITNKTLVPACDTFYVQHKWIIEVVRRPLTATESAQPPQLRISVGFESHFTKLSLLKLIVQKSVRKEAKDWMAGYVAMLQGAIKELTAVARVHSNNNSSSALSSITPTKPKTALMVPTTRLYGVDDGDDSEAEASALSSDAAAKPSMATVVSTANNMARQQHEQQQQQPQGDVLVFAKSVQRLVAFVIVLVILLGVLLLLQLVALQATLSTLQLQVKGVYVQNAMVMYQLQRQIATKLFQARKHRASSLRGFRSFFVVTDYSAYVKSASLEQTQFDFVESDKQSEQ